MFNPRLGASIHSISTCIDDNIIKLVADSKIKTIELAHRLFLKDMEDMKTQIKKLSASGIKIASVHVNFIGFDISAANEKTRREAICNTFEAIALAEEFDAPILVMHASLEPIKSEERDERKKYAKESILEIAEKCEKSDKRLAIEILPRTCLGNTADELLELTAGAPENIVGFCLDTNHLMDKPFILANTVKTFGKRLIATHLSDYDGIDEKHMIPGTGVLDWQAFMKALERINYTGPFNFECVFDKDKLPEERINMIEKSYDYLINCAG